VSLGGILFFPCLRLSLGEVGAGLCDRGRLWRLSWMVPMKLVALPLAVYALTLAIAPNWATGMLLVTAMPAGLSTIAFVDLHRGDRVLALMLVLASSALCPLTIPLFMAWASPGPAIMVGEVARQAGGIALILIVPFVLAQVVRRVVPGFVARHDQRWNLGAIASVSVMIFCAVAAHRAQWSGWDAARLAGPLALTCLAAALAWAVGWAALLVCGAVYMNNGLALAFATSFYPGDPTLLLPTILMQIPMVAGVALWRFALPRAGAEL
jgi:BASS family bile acid:Na+ symporter